jgi:hypothetical protein
MHAPRACKRRLSRERRRFRGDNVGNAYAGAKCRGVFAEKIMTPLKMAASYCRENDCFGGTNYNDRS